MRTIPFSRCLIAALLFSSLASAQNKAALEKKLTSEYALTQPTADNFDIVTTGAILALKKPNLVMAPAWGTNWFPNTYKDGKIGQNALGKSVRALDRFNSGGMSAPANRTFVPGERVWVTRIECKDDGVVFNLLSDAYGDVRYKAALKFHFSNKGPMPSADEMAQLVAEVFRIQPADDGGGQQQAPSGDAPQRQQQSARPSAEPALAPIPPPPPPPDEPQAPPKRISLGQTRDQVVGTFGAPDRVVKLGTKEIYVYKDLKVTFVNGKVTDAQ